MRNVELSLYKSKLCKANFSYVKNVSRTNTTLSFNLLRQPGREWTRALGATDASWIDIEIVRASHVFLNLYFGSFVRFSLYNLNWRNITFPSHDAQNSNKKRATHNFPVWLHYLTADGITFRSLTFHCSTTIFYLDRNFLDSSLSLSLSLISPVRLSHDSRPFLFIFRMTREMSQKSHFTSSFIKGHIKSIID